MGGTFNSMAEQAFGIVTGLRPSTTYSISVLAYDGICFIVVIYFHFQNKCCNIFFEFLFSLIYLFFLYNNHFAVSGYSARSSVVAVTTNAAAVYNSQMPTGDLPNFVSIFENDFLVDAPLGLFPSIYASNFSFYPYGYTDTSFNTGLRNSSVCGYYYPERTLSAAGGIMDAWLHFNSTLRQYLVAAVLPRLPTNLTYGRFSMRMRADVIPGYLAVPLLWPNSNVWADGEIDFANCNDLTVGCMIQGFNHYVGNPTSQSYFNYGVTNASEWHVYDLNWTPGQVEYFFDGKSIGIRYGFLLFLV